MGKIILGIDLGTTNSAVAIFRNQQVEIIPNALNEKLTPSVVAFDEKYSRLTVGRTAKDILALKPDRAAALFKRDMGSSKIYELPNARYTAEELSGFVLMHLKNYAESYLKQEVEDCVITVPAYFNEDQRNMTKSAAEFAGLKVIRILNEPTAAAIAYGMQNLENESRFMVFDLGGGTFDICLMELFEGVLEVISVSGDTRLGGEDFTKTLCEYVLKEQNIEMQRVIKQDPEGFALLYKRAELAKRALSNSDEVKIKVPSFEKIENEEYEVSIRDEETDRIFSYLIRRMIKPCRDALRGANIKKEEIEHIILAGGATRMPCIKRFIKELFEIDAKTELDPDLSIVQGAAIQAALIYDNKDLSEIVVTDILSHSLGTEISQLVEEDTYIGDIYDPIIHRNTVIPVSRVKDYVPIHPNARSIYFVIYEGESRKASENKKIGEIEIKLPKTGKKEVEVRFTYDINGILDVEVTVKETKEKINKVFMRSKKALSEKEVEQAKERIAQLKKDPLENPELRALIIKAELLYKELDSFKKGILGALLLELEAAGLSRKSKELDEVHKALLDFMQEHGEENW